MGSILKAALILKIFIFLFVVLLTIVQSAEEKSFLSKTGVSRNNDTDAVFEIMRVLSELKAAVQRLTLCISLGKNPSGVELDVLIVDVLKSLGDIVMEIGNVGTVIVEQVFPTFGLEQLREAQKPFDYLTEEIGRTVHGINESLMNQSEDLEQWTANIRDNLRYFNQTQILSTTCQIVDNVIQISTIELHSCCNITMKPILSLCQSFRALLGSIFGKMADVLHGMQICIEDKQSYLEYMKPCFQLAYGEVIELIETTTHLRRKFKRLLQLKILYSKCCLSLAFVVPDEISYNYTIYES